MGTRFTVQVYLKLQDKESFDAADLEKMQILVADDERDACESTCEILADIGMKADWVMSGDEALERLLSARAEGTDYAAVILDWKMPEKNGVETAREIRDRLGGEIPIIILSAYDWSDIEQEAREAGVDDFIEKPLFRSRLVHVLKSVMGSRRELKGSESGGEQAQESDLERLRKHDYTGRRVLLAEDNDLNAEIACELLEMIGITVERACDGQQAIDMATAKPEHYYDLIFMDIQMPVKNGYEAAAQIRAAGRKDLEEIPIVAMSADAFSDDITRAKRSGMNDHVAKPVELDKLSAALKKWISLNTDGCPKAI